VTIRRLGFEPFIRNLDIIIEGGIPEGSWINIQGPSGSLKTLHSLAWCLAGLQNKERCIYVSTGMDFYQLKRQLESVGWSFGKSYVTRLTAYTLNDKDFGLFEGIIIDLESLRYMTGYLSNRFKKNGVKFQYYNPVLLSFTIIQSLLAVGALEPTSKDTLKDITLYDVAYSRVISGLTETKHSKFKLNQDIKVRVVLDPISLFIGDSPPERTLTNIKIRLYAPNITYILTSEEQITGYITDGIIKLWKNMYRGEIKYYGIIDKMRETEHSKRTYNIQIKQEGKQKYIEWNEIEQNK